jgi:phenylalanyl-tRNA synthetase beta chain
MKIAYSWLSEHLNIKLEPEQISTLLTDCGLEVESMEAVDIIKGGLRGVVVGEVVECVKHPNADKLSLTKVNVGGPELLSIVCGAPNVAAGQKVLVATVGATLYPTNGEAFEIKKSKIRGELSEGMICAEDEIGLGTSHAGILILNQQAQVGMPAAEHLQLTSDYVFEIGLTPNRSDAASHHGVARDVVAVWNADKMRNRDESDRARVLFPEVLPLDEQLPESDIQVVVSAPEACKRYAALVIDGLKVGPSPEWMQNRMRSIGVRPINNVVDVTNYVLHELGQPLHAFDAAAIKSGRVEVKKLPADTKFVTLDGIERELGADDLMICDGDVPMCIAGVFGGLQSGVTEQTTKIFLESAYFDAIHVRKTSKLHQLKTDASFRFERGCDPDIVIRALQRAAQLLQQIADGVPVNAVTDFYPEPVLPLEVAFKYDNCDRIIGKTIDHKIIKSILSDLGCEIISEGKDALLLNVPRFKVDVTREIDLYEEVLRIYGYNNIDFPDKVHASLNYVQRPNKEMVRERTAERLVALGFSEIVNNSLTKERYSALAAAGGVSPVKLTNPLSSDLGVMRTHLLFGGIETVVYNVNRKQSDLRLFEFGSTYLLNEKNTTWPYVEEYKLLLLAYGRQLPESWNATQEAAGWMDVKQPVSLILEALGLGPLSFEALESETYPLLVQLKSGKHKLGVAGAVAGDTLSQLGGDGVVWFAEINWDKVEQVLGGTKEIRYREVSKFPAVRRDLALILDKQVTYAQVEQLAWQTERAFLKSVRLFDVFEGQQLGADKKSYAVSFILENSEATLTDQQIDMLMEKISKVMTDKLGAVIRS